MFRKKSKSNSIKTPGAQGSPAGTGSQKPASSKSGFSGFQSRRTDQAQQQSTVAPRTEAPLPKRPKGKLFVGACLIFGLLFIGANLWNSFFRYQAYGVIEGRVVTVSAPWDGVVQHWLVKEGDIVEQDQVIALLNNIALDHQIAEVKDQLEHANSHYQALIARLQLDLDSHSERGQKSTAEYLQAWGTLMQAQSQLEAMDQEFKRARKLYQSNALSVDEYEQSRFKLVGQKRNVEKMADAVEVLRQRAQPADQVKENQFAQLNPQLTKIRNLQNQIKRLQKEVKQGEIRAPVSGRIIRRQNFTGEFIQKNHEIAEILEHDSTEIIIYMPQQLTGDLKAGDRFELSVAPFDQPVHGTILRLGDQYVDAPTNIAKYYRNEQRLLPIHVKPHPEYRQWMALRLNGVVKVPNRLENQFDWRSIWVQNDHHDQPSSQSVEFH